MRKSDDSVTADVLSEFGVSMLRSAVSRKWLVFRPDWVDADKWYVATGFEGYCPVASAQEGRRLAKRLASERQIAMLST